MDIFVYINSFFKTKKRLTINYYILSIKDINNNDEDIYTHIKDISIINHNDNTIVLQLSNNKTIELFLDNTEDIELLIKYIKDEQSKYRQFINEYFINNNCYNLIPNESLIEYLNECLNFIKIFMNNIKEYKINNNLCNILNESNEINIKIENIINLLASNNSYRDIVAILKEIKSIFNSCYYNTNIKDIEIFMNNFNNLMTQKYNEIYMLINAIQEELNDYIKIKLNNNKNEDKEYKNTLINEQMEIEINNLEIENNIINEYINTINNYNK